MGNAWDEYEPLCIELNRLSFRWTDGAVKR